MRLRTGLSFVVLSMLIIGFLGCASSRVAEDTADSGEESPVVAIFGEHVLSLDDLRREYARNSSVAVEGDAEDFLNRYVDFRLKVMEAEAIGYHRDEGVLEEIELYRTAFARPYLVDREVLAPILLDFYEKQKQEVHASHIFAFLRPEMSLEDSMEVYDRMQALRDSVLGGMDIGEVAFKYSEDPAATSPQSPQGFRGDLGYFGAGRMIKEFEDKAYTEPLGVPSEVFSSDFGYHIVVVHDRRPTIQDIRLSQILVRIPDDHPDSVAAAREKIAEAKARLDAGQNFAFVASEMTEHETSRTQGGDVNFIRYSYPGLDSAFKEIAWGIENVGDVTDTLRTGYGYQILKLTERDELGTYEEEYEALRRQARSLPRMIKAEEALSESAREQFPASFDTTALTALIEGITRDSIRFYLSALGSVDSLKHMIIAQVGDSVYTLRDLSLFTSDTNNRIPIATLVEKQLENIGDAFLSYAAITQTAMMLQEIDEEFSYIMQNFHDGLLLFRLMEDSVWSYATADTAALEGLFNASMEEYQFPDRHRIMEVFSYDAATHESAVQELDNGMSWEDFSEYVRNDSILTIRFDSVMVQGPNSGIHDRAIVLEPGERTEAFTYNNGFLALFNDGIAPARPKTFDEARAEIITLYQNILEARLLERLHTKYKVQLFPENVSGLFDSRDSLQ